MVEVSIEAVRISVVTEEHVVLLREINGTRVLPVFIGAYEANAIAHEIRGQDLGRPLTHDLLRDLIRELGSAVERIVVSDIRDRIFISTLYLQHNGRIIEVDSRTSDALALAVRVRCPIYVEDHVMDQAGLEVAIEREEPEEEPGAEVTEAENERLSVFRDFINNMDVDNPEGGTNK